MIRALLQSCRGYLRLVMFMAAVLVGVQVPAFISVYENTLLAHLSEVRQNLQPFEEDARVHTDGSLEKLVQRYQKNTDAAVRDGAKSLGTLVQRRVYLQGLADKLTSSQWSRIWYGLFDPDPRLFSEARQHYDYQIVLDAQAIGWGLISGLVIIALFDVLLGLCTLPFNRRRVHL